MLAAAELDHRGVGHGGMAQLFALVDRALDTARNHSAIETEVGRHLMRLSLERLVHLSQLRLRIGLRQSWRIGRLRIGRRGDWRAVGIMCMDWQDRGGSSFKLNGLKGPTVMRATSLMLFT